MYLDAFARLLERRRYSDELDVAYYLRVVCRAEGVPVPPPRDRSVDAMFRALGAVICTPEQRRLLRYF